MALCVWKEARGEGELGMKAVADVIVNRAKDQGNGALYYANLAHVSSGWFEDNIVKNTVLHPQVAVIGKQTFYK